MNQWQKHNLGDVCKLIGGGTPSKSNIDFYHGSIPWATVRDMKDEIITTTDCSITEEAVKKSSTNVIPSGNVVIATRVGLGKVCMVAQDTAINQDLRAIIPNSEKKLLEKFLFWWCKSVAHLIKKEGTGATVQGVKVPFVKSLQIPVPPLEEQKRIVEILDEAFERIAIAEANTKKNLANAIELFDNSVFSNFYNKSYKKYLVSDLVLSKKGAMRTGPFGSQLLHSEFVDRGIAVLGIDNAVNNQFQWGKRRFITKEKYNQLLRYTVKPGDVLITIMGTCGRCAVVPENIPVAINTKHLCCISLDRQKCLPEFLHAYFLYHPTAQKFLNDRAKGSIMAGLNMTIIKELPVFLPSIKEQTDLVKRCNGLLKNTKRLEKTYQRKLEALAELKQSILQKAFTGQLT